MRKGITALILAIVAVAAIALYAIRSPDVHHSAERREWKDNALTAIKGDLRQPGGTAFVPGRAEWLSKKKILCEDGSWLNYRQQCHKVDPKIHDIFVGRGSDGKWYYSDYHFCVDAMVLSADGQPESLQAFVDTYFLVEFDGSSDEALKPTWNQ